MKRFTFCSLTLLLIFSSLSVYAELRVMTLNTEWLWTPHDRHIDGSKFNKGDMTPSAYRAEIKFYATLIRGQQTNIVAISEIENKRVANDLADELGVKWHAYFMQGRDTATGQDVGLLSNLPLVHNSMTDFGFPSGRLPGTAKKKRLSKVLGAQFWVKQSGLDSVATAGLDPYKLGVITSHFLSKRKDNFKKSQNRQRQAYALVKAMDFFKETSKKLIVMGDFNDEIRSPTLKILRSKYSLKTIQQCHVDINSMGPNASNRLPQKNDRRIDHILYDGLDCKSQQVIDLLKYSDHDAILGVFK